MNQNQDSPPESCLSGPSSNRIRQYQVCSTSFIEKVPLKSASKDEDMNLLDEEGEEEKFRNTKRHERGCALRINMTVVWGGRCVWPGSVRVRNNSIFWESPVCILAGELPQ